MRRLMYGLAAVVLSGCSLTLPVTGVADDGAETFTGTTTGYGRGAGDLTVTSSRGAVCTGQFVFTTQRHGYGTFRCNDGRTGPFEFFSTGSRGTGWGVVGGRRFTFEFGG